MVACTCAMSMLGSKNESGLDEDAGCAVVDSTAAGTRPLALVEETVGAVGTWIRYTVSKSADQTNKARFLLLIP